MRAYMVADGAESEIVLGESMTDAIKRYISKVLGENMDDSDFSFTENDIESCAYLGEVYNWSQFVS